MEGGEGKGKEGMIRGPGTGGEEIVGAVESGAFFEMNFDQRDTEIFEKGPVLFVRISERNYYGLGSAWRWARSGAGAVCNIYPCAAKRLLFRWIFPLGARATPHLPLLSLALLLGPLPRRRHVSSPVMAKRAASLRFSKTSFFQNSSNLF